MLLSWPRCMMLVKIGVTLVVAIVIGLYCIANNNGSSINILGWKINADGIQRPSVPIEFNKMNQEVHKFEQVQPPESPVRISDDKNIEQMNREELEREIAIQRAKLKGKVVQPKTDDKLTNQLHDDNLHVPKAEDKVTNQHHFDNIPKTEDKLTNQHHADNLHKTEEKLTNQHHADNLPKQDKATNEHHADNLSKQDKATNEHLPDNLAEQKNTKIEQHSSNQHIVTEQKQQKPRNEQNGIKQGEQNKDPVESMAEKKTVEEKNEDNSTSPDLGHEPMNLAVVACGDRLEETLVMIKSALIFSRTMLNVHIFADADLQPQFKEALHQIPADVQQRFAFMIYDIQFPEGQKPDEWRKLFKTCATQRLFLPDVLLDVKRLLYVDTDILFMRPLEDIWAFYNNFNSSHIAALSWEHEDGSAGWYNRFARHPYYPPYGVNSGVLLMDLPALRANDWTNQMKKYYQEYKLKITWGDQDLINIFFHYLPEKLYIFRCNFNYRPDHCMYMQNCKPAKTLGVSLVHGCRGVYHNEKQILFKAIYNTFKEYELGQPLDSHLLDKMRANLDQVPQTADRCAQHRNIFTIQLESSVKSAQNPSNGQK